MLAEPPVQRPDAASRLLRKRRERQRLVQVGYCPVEQWLEIPFGSLSAGRDELCLPSR